MDSRIKTGHDPWTMRGRGQGAHFLFQTEHYPGDYPHNLTHSAQKEEQQKQTKRTDIILSLTGNPNLHMLTMGPTFPTIPQGDGNLSSFVFDARVQHKTREMSIILCGLNCL